MLVHVGPPTPGHQNPTFCGVQQLSVATSGWKECTRIAKKSLCTRVFRFSGLSPAERKRDLQSFFGSYDPDYFPPPPRVGHQSNEKQKQERGQRQTGVSPVRDPAWFSPHILLPSDGSTPSRRHTVSPPSRVLKLIDPKKAPTTPMTVEKKAKKVLPCGLCSRRFIQPLSHQRHVYAHGAGIHDLDTRRKWAELCVRLGITPGSVALISDSGDRRIVSQAMARRKYNARKRRERAAAKLAADKAVVSPSLSLCAF